MLYKMIMPSGSVVETDNVQDVVALERALATRNGKPSTPAPEAGRKEFALSERGSMVLKALKKNPDGLLNQDLLEQSGVDAGSLPPVFRGLKNWATGLGHELNDFIARDRVAMKDKLVTKFRLTEMGRKAVDKLKL